MKQRWLIPDLNWSEHKKWSATRWTSSRVDISFTNRSNRNLYQCLQKPAYPTKQPDYVRLNGRTLELQWQKERVALFQLATTCRDLIFRLQRNGLPLRVKRAACGGSLQRKCPKCLDTIETVKNLFWDYPYAHNIWKMFCPPWKDGKSEEIRW